jgi:hypothetical protein
MFVRLPMGLASKCLDVKIYLLGSVVNNVKLDILETNVTTVQVNISEVAISANHVLVTLMADKIMSVTPMGYVTARLDILRTNAMPV